MRARSRGRIVVRVGLVLVVAGTLLGPTRTDAQTAPAAALGGYQGSAAASGLHAFYNPEGLLPIPPPVDIGAPDALATIASGPSSFARASVLDPGDLLANPDAILSAASSAYPSGTLPAYPFRISAQYGVGEPSVESTPAPGLNARVETSETGSTAQATLPAVVAPAIATLGSLTAKTATHTDGSTVTVTSRSQAAGFNLLGLVIIDSVVTELSATSDGTETTFSGGTTIVGAKVLGMPVTIDADGIHREPGTVPLLQGLLGALVGNLNDALGNLGIRITVAGPVEVAGASAGQRGSDGLRIDLDLSPSRFPQVQALLDAIPPIDNPIPGAPSIEDLLAAAQARQLISISVGRGLVSLAARPAATFDGAPPPTSGGSFTPSPTFDLPGFVPDTSGSLAPPSSGGGSPAVPASSTELPVSPGVGAVVLLVLLASPFVGELLARFGAAVLAPDRSAHCSWEEP